MSELALLRVRDRKAKLGTQSSNSNLGAKLGSELGSCRLGLDEISLSVMPTLPSLMPQHFESLPSNFEVVPI